MKKNAFLFSVLCITSVFLLTAKLILVPITDLNNYPFIVSVDTWQWMEQSLNYLGESTTNYFRPPLLSIIAAFFIKFGFENYMGLIPQVSFVLMCISTFIIVNKMYSYIEAFTCIIFLTANAVVFSHSYYLNADYLCNALIATSFALVVIKKRLEISWTLLAFSFLAQSAFFMLPVYIFLQYTFIGRGFYKQKENVHGIIIFCVLLFSYFVYLKINSSGLFGASGIKLIGLDQLKGYLYMIMGVIGAIGIISLISYLTFLKKTWRTERKNFIFLMSWFFIPIVFFSFIVEYGVNWRYSSYYNTPLFVFISVGVIHVVKKNSSILKIILIFFIALIQNTTPDNFWPSPDNRVLLFPTIINGSGYFIDKEFNLQLRKVNYQFISYFKSDVDQMRNNAKKNLLSEEAPLVASIINQNLSPAETLTVFPQNAFTDKYVGKISFLSKRKAVVKTERDVYKLTNVVLFTGKLFYQDEYIVFVDNVLRTSGYKLFFNSIHSSLYISR